MISLTAEQKTIEGIFGAPNETYVIPMYQRPYSWGFDQFYELYKDLMGAFNDDESYFLGNIILARSKSYGSDGKSSVVDGQQRLITIWTLIKVLSLYLPDINSLQSALYVVPWSGKEKLPKIDSKIFENSDNKAIDEVFEFDIEKLESRYKEVLTDGVINEEKCHTKVEFALLYFYQQFIALQNDDFNLAGFAQFLMRKVTMLPIVQSADEQQDAENKALTIFETINNRGMDLEDADIFKARLYDSAYTKEQREEFISMWVDFKSDCDDLRLSIDDIFRYYSHVIRGRERITSNEKRLREFFTNESFSPLKTLSYKEVLEDLNKIIGIIKYLNKHRGDSDEVGIWLQILGAYTNQYPTYAIIVYLYYHNVDTDAEKGDFVFFLKSIVRYCFYRGSTTTVKFYIYSLIKTIANKGKIDEGFVYYVNLDRFSHLGRLQNAFALLAFHLDSNEPIPVKYSIDKIVATRDVEEHSDEWQVENPSEVCNSIGNLVVLDIAKRYNLMQEKYNYYMRSKSPYVKSILTSPNFSFDDWKKRNEHLKLLLARFFGNPNSYDTPFEIRAF